MVGCGGHEKTPVVAGVCVGGNVSAVNAVKFAFARTFAVVPFGVSALCPALVQ